MRLSLRQPTLQLAKGELISLREAKVLTLEVCRGRVWVTSEGHGGDAFPRPGDRMEIPPVGLTVIEAIEDSTVRLRAEPSGGVRVLAFLGAAAAGILRALRARFRAVGVRRRATC